MTKRTMVFGRIAGLRIAGLTLVVLIAFCAGTSLRPPPAARAGVREGTPTPHFLAGGERALPVLEEISKTLKQIDTRLSRIEKIAADAAGRRNGR